MPHADRSFIRTRDGARFSYAIVCEGPLHPLPGMVGQSRGRAWKSSGFRHFFTSHWRRVFRVVRLSTARAAV